MSRIYKIDLYKSSEVLVITFKSSSKISFKYDFIDSLINFPINFIQILDNRHHSAYIKLNKKNYIILFHRYIRDCIY